MEQLIIPSLWFDYNAKEALEWYTRVFADSKIISESPTVTEASLAGVRFIGINGGAQFRPNPSVSFMVTCENKNEIDVIWQQLAEQGQVLMALDAYPWSQYYGWLQDQYGVSWQLYLGKLSDVNHQKIVPSIMYSNAQRGHCEKAVDLYRSVFKNSVSQGILKYDSDDAEGLVQHTQFVLEEFTLMAMDSDIPHGFDFNEGVSLTILCNNQDEIDYYWNALTEEGEESRCGWCKDAFGLSWQIVPKDIAQYLKTPVAIEALLKMQKIIIADLK